LGEFPVSPLKFFLNGLRLLDVNQGKIGIVGLFFH